MPPFLSLFRFEIEQGLMDGSVAVKDVPAVWAAKMKELLGVDVPGDAQGCLQDIHWCVRPYLPVSPPFFLKEIRSVLMMAFAARETFTGARCALCRASPAFLTIE